MFWKKRTNIYTKKEMSYDSYEHYNDSTQPVRYEKAGNCFRKIVSTGSTAKIMCAGDLMCEPAMSKAVFHNGKYFYESCFAYVRSVFSEADLAIANLETMVCPSAPYAIDAHKNDGRYHCNAPVEYLDALRYAGFDALAMANNHCADTGAEGLVDTINNVEAKGFMHTGAFRNPDVSDIFSLTSMGSGSLFSHIPNTSIGISTKSILPQRDAL